KKWTPTTNGTGTHRLEKPPSITRDERMKEKINGKLSFKNEKVEGFVAYIQEWTGKAVIVKSQQISAQSITLVDNRELTKQEALDLIFMAFRLNDIAVVELPDIIVIVGKTEVENVITNMIVLPPDVDPLTMTEEGVYVTKIFKLKNTKANDIGDRLQ